MVEACVVRVEEYGLYLQASEMTVVVLVPDVADVPIHLRDAWTVGQRTRVRLVDFIEQDNVYKGSMRGLGDVHG